MSLPGIRRTFAILEEAARRYPEDPEIWYQVGEARFHSGFVAGHTWSDARAAFDRAIALDSAFAPAYIHPVEIALNDNDAGAALRYVRGYLAVSSVLRASAPFAIHHLDPLEVQACLAGSIGERLDAPMIEIAAAVEHDLLDAGLERPLGDELAHGLGRG